MPYYKRFRISGGSYFFTANLKDRNQSLCDWWITPAANPPYAVDSLLAAPPCWWTFIYVHLRACFFCFDLALAMAQANVAVGLISRHIFIQILLYVGLHAPGSLNLS